MDIAARFITEDRETRNAKPEYIQYLNLVLFIGFLFSLGFARLYIGVKELGMFAVSPTKVAAVGLSPDLIKLKTVLNSQINLANEFQDYQVAVDKDKLVVEFATFELFDSGRAEVEKKNFRPIQNLAKIIFNSLPNSSIEIEGYTDDTRLLKNKNNFPSNWELSSARAVAIMYAFQDVGFKSEQLKVAGRGPSRPKYANRTASGDPIRENQAKNRRVVIHIGN
ncbi:MAG: OmpA family protein [Bdellovibrionales bacterium]|nr:OmpA family protein [Bdellovibrionales bacterium]